MVWKPSEPLESESHGSPLHCTHGATTLQHGLCRLKMHDYKVQLMSRIWVVPQRGVIYRQDSEHLESKKQEGVMPHLLS